MTLSRARATLSWLAAMTFCAAAPGLARNQTWIVTEGTATFSLNESHLADLGLRLVEDRRTAVSPRESMLEPPLLSFRMAADTQLGFRVENGSFREFLGAPRVPFEGGLAFQAFHPRTKRALSPAFVFDFGLQWDQEAGRPTIAIHTADPSLPTPLRVVNAGVRLRRQPGELAFAMGDLVITEEWARRLGQPYLAGQWVGGFDVRFQAAPRGGAAGAPEPVDRPGGQGGTLDVLLGELFGITSQGHIGTHPTGTAGLSAATTSCNAGEVDVPWNGPMAETHPFIGLALFRLDQNGVLEMIGQNWMKHGFFALSHNQCGFGCPKPSNGSYLAVGCSDTYSAGNNGNRFYLGPRDEVNPFTGDWEACGSFFDEPVTPDPGCNRSYVGDEPNDVNHRLEVFDGDLDNGGATYYYEGVYFVTDDDVPDNNIGWRECSMSWTGLIWSFSTVGAGRDPNPGAVVDTWGDQRDTVTVVPDGSDGRVILAVDVTDLGGGTWHYEYALYNRDSDRGLHTFSVPVGSTGITNVGFHDIDQDAGNDWTATVADGLITWATDDYATDPGANALKFQTMFNFRFDADGPPLAASARSALFKPGPGSVFFADTQAPHGGVTAALPGAPRPGGLSLSSGEPNPFSETTRVRFTVPERRRVRLSVLDVTGRAIQVLVDGEAPAGQSALRWNGRDARGTRVASGVYFFRLDAGNESLTAKTTLLR